MVQEQISNKASLKAMEEVEQKAQEMHSTLENQVNEKPSMEQVRSAIEESNGPLREELQKGQEMRSALENQVNEKPSMEQVRSAIKESNETHREELQKGQEIHSALENQVNEKPSMEQVRSAIQESNGSLREELQKGQEMHSALENQVNEKPSMEQVRSAIQESNGSLREELQKGQEMHSALENQVNEKPSMEQVRSAIQESNGPLREELQKSSNSININFDKLSNDLQRKHTETANSVNSLDITVSTIAKNVHNIETSILPTALEPFRNDIDAVVTAVRCVDKLDSKHKETEKSVNALESKMSAVTTNIEAIEKSVVPNALDPIQKDITALKATTESLSNIGTEQSAVQQTVQRLESDISRLQAQTSPESIEATVHEAILTSRRPAQTQDTSLPLPNRKHFEDMAHRLTDVICANREIRTTVDMHVKESEEEKEKHQNQLLEQVNLIRSMQQDMEKFKERMYKKEAEMARLQEAAVQRDREVLKASEDIYQSLEAIEERLNSAPTPPSSDTTIATSLEALENRVLRDYDSANHYFYKYRKLSEKFEHRLAELERERQSTPCENGTNSGMANLTVYIDSKLEEYDRTLQSYVPREVVNTLVSRVTLLEHETERLKNKQLDQGCKDNHESQHTKAMDDLDAALHADIENLKADFKAAMDSMSQSLVSRIDTKTTEAFDSTNDCIHQVVDALRGELGPTSEDFLKTLQHGMEEKKPEWLEAVTGLISETFDPNNNETRFKFGPLFKKLFEEEYADCNRRLQALENGAKRADETTPCRVADTEPYDYLAPEDYNELRKFSGKTRFDVDNVRSEVGTVVVSLRNLRRNAEKKVAESKKDIARFQENMTMENNRSVEGLSVFKQSITQNLDVIVLAQQQVSKVQHQFFSSR
jgi:hypothetical protein